MRSQTLSWTTAANGAATVLGDAIPGGGRLVKLVYLPGTTDTGATVTVTCESDFSEAVMTKTTAGTSNIVWYPRALVNGVADGAALTGTAGGDRTEIFLIGRPKVVIASGGNTLSGKVTLYYE